VNSPQTESDYLCTKICYLFGLLIICVGTAFADNGNQSIHIAAVSSAGSCSVVDDPESTSKIESMSVGRLAHIPTQEELARCLNGIDEVMRLVHAGHSLVIDTRESNNSLSDLDGTISVPLYAVHTKNFIKDRNIVLLGNGIDDLKLVPECIRVQKSGAKRVRILKGGIRAWEQSVANKAHKTLSLGDKIVKSQDLYARTLGSDWLVLTNLSSTSERKEISKLFPKVPVLTAYAGKRINKALRKGKNIKVLVVTRNGDDYHAIHASLHNRDVTRDYYLEGGINAYRRYLMTQNAYQERLRQLAIKKKSLCGG
jgi:rhodanese-related sulfurtransferase